MRQYLLAAIMLLLIAYATSCSKSNDAQTNNTNSNLKQLSSSKIQNSPYKITSYIYTDSVIVGYNPILFTIQDTTTGNTITDANITMYPLMTMAASDHRHSGPTEQPYYDTQKSGYLGAFMPIHGAVATYTSDGFTGWKMKLIATINKITYDTISYDFSTKSVKINTKFFTSVAGNDGNTYYLSLISPQQSAQQNGTQTLEIGIYKGENKNLSFVPVSDLIIGNYYPYMPDMGHSSANNVTPTSMVNGHYKGVVNFSMGGFWTLNFTGIKSNGNTLIDSTALEVAF